MFKTIQPEALTSNTFKTIGKDWLLVTACTKEELPTGEILTGRVNTMTASWGGFGIMWNKPVATIHLRPSRYTKEIIDSTDTFSLSVLGEKYKNALNYCGKHSGRDGDKLAPCKLSVSYMNNTPWIEQANTVLICRKLYAQELDPNCFTDELICKQNYKNNDYHTMYIAEILKVMVDKR